MDTDVAKIYSELLDIYYKKFHSYNTAWDNMIDFIAVDKMPLLLSQLNHKFEWVDEEFGKKTRAVYDLIDVKSDRYDYLGDLYIEMQGHSDKKRKGQFLTPDSIVEMMVRMTVDKIDREKPINVLDPCVGTGRFLVKANEMLPEANLFGVDIDIRALRIAMVNCATHNIRAYFLCADSLVYDIDIATENGRYNWQFSNRWYSCWDKLKITVAKNQNFTLGFKN